MKSIKLLTILLCGLLLGGKEASADFTVDKLLWGTVEAYGSIVLNGGASKNRYIAPK